VAPRETASSVQGKSGSSFAAFVLGAVIGAERSVKSTIRWIIRGERPPKVELRISGSALHNGAGPCRTVMPRSMRKGPDLIDHTGTLANETRGQRYRIVRSMQCRPAFLQKKLLLLVLFPSHASLSPRRP
jgi:hypothetical protein